MVKKRRTLIPLVQPSFDEQILERCQRAQDKYRWLTTHTTIETTQKLVTLSKCSRDGLSHTYNLTHELCRYFPSLNCDEEIRQKVISRNVQEIDAYSKVISKESINIGTADLLVTINKHCGGGGNIRKRDMRIVSKNGIEPVYMPESHHIKTRLAEISRLLCESLTNSDVSDVPPLIMATWIMALITNLHPFIDGNGRLSRVIFNLVLSRQLIETAKYLDLCAYMWISQGGFEIRLRQAELHSDWTPLINFMCDSIDLAQSQLVSNRHDV